MLGLSKMVWISSEQALILIHVGLHSPTMSTVKNDLYVLEKKKLMFIDMKLTW